jgi:hypothetical protein
MDSNYIELVLLFYMSFYCARYFIRTTKWCVGILNNAYFTLTSISSLNNLQVMFTNFKKYEIKVWKTIIIIVGCNLNNFIIYITTSW